MLTKHEDSGVFVVSCSQANDFDTSSKPVPFEDALNKTGFGIYNYKLFATCCILLIAMAFEIFGGSFFLIYSSCDLELTTKIMGIIGATPLAGIIVTAHMWGYLADTRGRRHVLMLSMGGSFAMSMVASFAPHWIFLMVFKFISACFVSASNGVTYALLGECTPQQNRSKFVLLMTSGLLFSQGLMALVAWLILRLEFNYDFGFFGMHYKPWRLLIQALALPCGMAMVCLMSCWESPKYLISQGRENDSLKVLRKMFAANTGRRPEDYPVTSIYFQEEKKTHQSNSIFGSMWNQTIPLFKGDLLKHTLVIGYVGVVVYTVTPSYIVWLPKIANSYFQTPSVMEGAASIERKNFCGIIATTAPVSLDPFMVRIPQQTDCHDKIDDLPILMIIAFSGFTSIFNIVNSYMIQFIGKKNAIIVIQLAAGVGGLVIQHVTDFIGSIFVFFLFLSTVVCLAMVTAYSVEVFPTYLRCMAVCLIMMVGRAFSIISINLLGIYMEKNCAASFYVFTGIILSGAAVALLLPNDKNTKLKSDIITTKL